MRPFARSLALLLAFGFVACSKRPINDPEDAGGSMGGGPAGAAGFDAGATAGTGGGAMAGSTGGGAIAGSTGGSMAGTGGGAIAGSRGGAIAGSGGSASAGASGGAAAGTGGGAIGGRGGAGGGATAGTSGAGLGPIRLVIFYTRWGTTYPEWFPTGSERNVTLSTVLQPLEPHKSELIVLSGLTNASVSMQDGGAPLLRGTNASNDPSNDAMISLLTAQPAGLGGLAYGPSLDTIVGDCGGAAGPPLRLAIGKFGFEDNPGVSFGANGTAIRGDGDPGAVATRVLGHTVTSPDPAGNIDDIYPALGAAHMDVLVEALATGKSCAATLMWGDQVSPSWLGSTISIHELSHLSNGLYNGVTSNAQPSPSGQFVALQRWYAQQFASLLDRLRAVPVGPGTLLDRSVVVWISESGSGSDHTGYFIPVVIAGRAGGRLDVGRFLQVKPRPVPIGEVQTIVRTQGDLLAALAGLWGIASFGDPAIARQPLTEILTP
jgi:hypothetical protein